MPSAEFNKKLAVEKELIKSDIFRFANLEFDRTGYFIMYPSMIGKLFYKVSYGH
jgi:peptidylprolyl isomerase domain and WD repeat-containing protein 1